MAIRPIESSPAVRAGIYTRISWDPGGQRAGVERQRVDCEARCSERGWEIAQYFEDNDRSAYSGKRRPAYEGLLAAIEERRLDAVVTWHNDRLHRSPRELEAFIDLVERSGVRVAVVSGGDYDLTTPEGRFTARIVGAVARKESEDRSRRVRRKHLELAEQGRPASHLGWGVRNEAERVLIGEAASRVLAGQGLMTITKDWNRRGVPGPTECPWTAPTLRKVLLSARVAGLREHHADPSGKVLGSLTPAVWEGAIDRHTWDHVRSVLLNPERLTLGKAPTKYLLTGLAFCGTCGSRMMSRPRDHHTKRYVCAGRRPGHQLGILASPLDELVASRALEVLTTPALRKACLARSGQAEDHELADALAELGSAQGRLQTLDDDYYVHGVLALRRYRSVRIRLEREVERLHGRVDGASRQRVLLHPDPQQLWDSADLAQRRDLVRLVVRRVVVMPARRGARFDPSRVRVEIPALDVGLVVEGNTAVDHPPYRSSSDRLRDTTVEGPNASRKQNVETATNATTPTLQGGREKANATVRTTNSTT